MMNEDDNFDLDEISNYQERNFIHKNEKNLFCPYLGLKFDPKSWVGYPSPINYCHRVKPLAVPKFEHQREYCLSNNYSQCPIIQVGPGQRMPKTIRSTANKGSSLKKIIFIEVLVGLLIIAIILGAIFWKQILLGFEQIARQQPSVTQTSFILETSTPTIRTSPTSTVTNTPTLEDTPTPTQTLVPPTKTPGFPTPTIEPPDLALETPIGQEPQFIIHAVVPGESLEMYAREYNTTVEAIRAVNFNLPSFLPLDWFVVIPLNTVDVSGIPPFEPYEVQQSVSVEVLADLLSVDLTDLRLYNLIPMNYTLNPGEWLLVPRQP